MCNGSAHSSGCAVNAMAAFWHRQLKCKPVKIFKELCLITYTGVHGQLLFAYSVEESPFLFVTARSNGSKAACFCGRYFPLTCL